MMIDPSGYGPEVVAFPLLGAAIIILLVAIVYFSLESAVQDYNSPGGFSLSIPDFYKEEVVIPAVLTTGIIMSFSFLWVKDKWDGLFIEEAENNSKPYANSRPSYAEGQVEEVWNNAINEEGQVIDPTGAEINWDRSLPRNGQWDMGHIPGQKYSDKFDLYMNGEMSLEDFLDWYHDPANYRPELPNTNRGHWYE